MSWNGSENKCAAAVPQKAERKSPPSKGRGLVALIVIVIGGAFAIWFFGGHGKSTTSGGEGTRRPTKIAEVKPQIVTNKVVEAVAEKPKPDPNARPTKVGEILNGYIKLPSGRLHRIRGEYTNDTSTANHAAYAIFDHSCDNEIACYLTLEPGQSLVGTPYYNGRFTKEFLKSLESPLIPPEGSSDEDRELYKAVRDAKIELKAAYDRGEDIEKIMLDTRKELQEMGRYKITLERDLRKMIRENAGDMTDVGTLVEAANKMLEAKGIAPIEFGPVAKKRLERYLQSNINKEK